MSTQSITSRMQALRVDVETDVEDRHVAAILRELRKTPAGPVPVRTSRGVRRRLVVTLVAAFALLLPAVAIAAEEAVPGDVLYPVKQSTEWARSLVDSGVAQQHRVRELEIVIERDAPIGVVADRFEASVAAVDDQAPELVQRVDRARTMVRDRYGVDLGPIVSPSGPGDSTGEVGPGNGKTSRSGAEQRSGQGAADTSVSTTTTASTEPPTDSGGTGSNTDTGTDGTTTPSTTRSTTGQPYDTPEPGSGGNRP